MSEFRGEGDGNEVTELWLRSIARHFRYGQFIFPPRRLLDIRYNVWQIPHEQILRRFRQLISKITLGFGCDAIRVERR